MSEARRVNKLISGTKLFGFLLAPRVYDGVCEKTGKNMEEGGTVWVMRTERERVDAAYIFLRRWCPPPSDPQPALTGSFEGLRFPDAARPSPAVQARTVHLNPLTPNAISAFNVVVVVVVPKLPVR